MNNINSLTEIKINFNLTINKVIHDNNFSFLVKFVGFEKCDEYNSIIFQEDKMVFVGKENYKETLFNNISITDKKSFKNILKMREIFNSTENKYIYIQKSPHFRESPSFSLIINRSLKENPLEIIKLFKDSFLNIDKGNNKYNGFIFPIYKGNYDVLEFRAYNGADSITHRLNNIIDISSNIDEMYENIKEFVDYEKNILTNKEK